MSERALFTFEGLDGSGKTTNTRLLEADLTTLGYSTVLLTSPSRSLLGNFIRTNFLSLTPHTKDRLFLLDMEESLKGVSPETEVVLFDRYTDSIFTSNYETDLGDLINQSSGMPVPQKTYLLDITPECSWEREESTTDHPLNLDWLKFKHGRYETLRSLVPDRIVAVDASRPLETVYADLLGNITIQLSMED